MRADAATPAAPVGAHARARARIHVHRREPLYIRHAVLPAPDRHPMLPRLDEHAPPSAWGSQIFIRPRTMFNRSRTARYRPSAGAQPPSARPHSKAKGTGQSTSLAQSRATESTRIARAGVYRSARVWARWNRAALPPRVIPLKLGCPARKTGRLVVRS